MATTPGSRREIAESGGASPIPVGARLPALTSETTRGPLRWRAPTRNATVVLFLSSDDETAREEYLDELLASARGFQLWDGRVIVIMPSAADNSISAHSSTGTGSDGPLSALVHSKGPVLLVTEPSGEAEHCGLAPGEGAILIADRWGQVYHGARITDMAELPAPAEIEEWFQYLSMQCPECGVIDQP